MEGGFDRLGRIPGVELGPGVESPLGVGVLDFRPGVPALSRCHRETDNLEIYRKYVANDTCNQLHIKLNVKTTQSLVLSILTSGISLDLREEELADDAVEAGLQGSFLRRRGLSRPFSLGEGRGVPRGDAGSWWKDKD